MTVKEIILLEKENTKWIHLLKEGIFYRAYNRSAMRVLEYIKPFKISRKYVKTVQQEIFYIGFPCASFETMKNLAFDKGWQLTEASIADAEKMITLSCETMGNENYEAWIKTNVHVVNGGQAASKPLDYCPSSGLEAACPKQTYGQQPNDIQNQIVNFPLENATPMDAMMFVYNLKQQIKNGNV
ncbi:MAG: hypothetical protein WCK78_10535 [Paludibacter sp.]